MERGGDILQPEVINQTQNPNELAESGQGNCDELRFVEELGIWDERLPTSFAKARPRLQSLMNSKRPWAEALCILFR
jgi:hypothetical protein